MRNAINFFLKTNIECYKQHSRQQGTYFTVVHSYMLLGDILNHGLNEYACYEFGGNITTFIIRHYILWNNSMHKTCAYQEISYEFSRPTWTLHYRLKYALRHSLLPPSSIPIHNSSQI
jgi:hypothetical protein